MVLIELLLLLAGNGDRVHGGGGLRAGQPLPAGDFQLFFEGALLIEMGLLRHLRQFLEQRELLDEGLAILEEILLRLGRAHLQDHHQFTGGDGLSVNASHHGLRRHGGGRLGPASRSEAKHINNNCFHSKRIPYAANFYHCTITVPRFRLRPDLVLQPGRARQVLRSRRRPIRQ